MKLPQFTIRDLLWLVLVCGLAVGWWMEHRHYANLKNDTLWRIIGEHGDMATQEAAIDLSIRYHPDARIRAQLEANRDELLENAKWRSRANIFR